MEVLINGKTQFFVENSIDLNPSTLNQFIEQELGLKSEDYYLLSNGKRLEQIDVEYGQIHIIPRILGGKGGFGSMLRAIGAQIEKTTNREACRDLSGRRLRDINEEQRLKNWINQQAEREKETKERKQKKLERLCEMPKHEFKDAQYDKERSELPEAVEDAVLCGLQASCSTKRKIPDKKSAIKKKKTKLWVDEDLEDDLSSESENDDDEEENKNSSSSTKVSDSENSSNEQHKDNKNDAEKLDNVTEEKGESKPPQENDILKNDEEKKLEEKETKELVNRQEIN